MEPAARVMADALANAPMRPPSVPVFANVRAAPLSDPAEIRKALVAQVTGTVRWRESVLAMAAQGVQVFCELGAGKVLSGLVKRTTSEGLGLSLGTPEEIAGNAARLKQG
jgi:[acyl-carrier-protein] S-malonyltransferase